MSSAIWKVSAIAIAVVVSGCTSVRSIKVTDNGDREDRGLVYYLPKQHIKLTVTVEQSGRRTATVERGEILPDHRQPFYAAFQRNANGEAKLELGVTETGLLNTEQKGTYTPASKSLLEAAASAAGTLSVTESNRPVNRECRAPGTYQTIVEVLPKGVFPGTFCDFKIEVSREADSSPLDVLSSRTDEITAPIACPDANNGLFYRQAIPYIVRTTDHRTPGAPTQRTDLNIVSMASPCRLLPVPRSFLASSGWVATFANGVPTSFDPSAASEPVALLGLPAKVLADYSTALTAGFTQQKSEDQGLKEILDAERARIAAELKLLACRTAVASGDMVKAADACK